jgi:hypothetical protein
MNNINEQEIIINQTQDNTNKAKSWKLCYIYLFIILGTMTLLTINLIATFDSFSEYRTVYIDPKYICLKQMTTFTKCQNVSDDYICTEANRSVKECFDDIMKINIVCHMYLSELHKCLETSTECDKEMKDFRRCNFSSEVENNLVYEYLSNN